jgi:hypothetical protein
MTRENMFMTVAPETNAGAWQGFQFQVSFRAGLSTTYDVVNITPTPA